jgi:phosphoethanolamine N-methyltransferase
LRYEKIFGAGFVSSGGISITKMFCSKLNLPQSPHILDIGSGLGGAAFYMARQFQATVVGLDLSPMMIEITKERAEQHEHLGISFRLEDVMTTDFADASFDLIWSRDALLHIPQKAELFERLYRWLKPNGQIMISDYSRKAGTLSTDFQEYMETSGYHLLDVETYGQLLAQAGITDVQSEDWTPLFIETLRQEQQNIQEKRTTFLQDFTENDLNYLLQRWEQKIHFCQNGDMRVGLWYGKRGA